MNIPFLSPSRCVLFITDELVHVYDVGSNAVRLVNSVAWKDPDFEEIVADNIVKDCRGKPVLILSDMVEQHYRMEKMPKVSPLDKPNIIKRKLAVAFPKYPIRAAFEIKVKDKRKTPGGIYLLAAVPESKAFQKIMSVVKRSLVPVAGFCLLPVESSDMVEALSQKLRKKGAEKVARWSIFLAQHESGELRQIVVNDGNLALTRITPIVDTDKKPDLWASEVNQELNATMGYLSRFGYSQDDGLDVIVISRPESANRLEALLEVPCNFHALTLQQAAHVLNVKLGSQEGNKADALHSAWIGRKGAFLLPMQSTDLSNVKTPRQVAALAMILMILAGGWFAYDVFEKMQLLNETQDDLQTAENEKRNLERIYEEEKERKNVRGIDDVDLFQNALGLYAEIKNDGFDPLPVLTAVGHELAGYMKIEAFKMKVTTQTSKGSDLDPYYVEKKQKTFDTTFQFIFPGTIRVEDGNKQMRDLAKRIAKALPDYEVNLQKELQDLTYSGDFTFETGVVAEKSSEDQYTAEIRVRKRTDDSDPRN